MITNSKINLLKNLILFIQISQARTLTTSNGLTSYVDYKKIQYKKKQEKKNLVQQKIQVINDMTAHI